MMPRGTRRVEVADGVVAIPTPAHTEGHEMYLVDDETLFAGDSLSWSADLEQLIERDSGPHDHLRGV